MNTHEILKVLQEDIHTVIIATTDQKGYPYTCAIDMMLLEDESLYFLTARGKAFYDRLMKQSHIALTGLKGEDTMSSVAISLQGTIKNIGHERLDEIFEKNPYMKEIYPDEISREVLEVFQIDKCQGEYFDLSQKPIYRQSFVVNESLKKSGYYVGEGCIGCKMCYRVGGKVMFLKKNNEGSIIQLSKCIEECDAIIIGAGSGLSTAAGLTYAGERFEKYFSDFIKKYHLRDMYSAGFYSYESLEEHWAYWSRHIYYNRYINSPKDTYQKLLELVKDKDYFVLTTNVDHQFQRAGFDSKRLFYTQGDYGLWQCSVPCYQETYDNEEIVREMIEKQKDMKVPTELVPRCLHCHAPLTMNLRCDNTFVQDEGWYQAYNRYEDFLRRHENCKVLYLELGVGGNTPAIIKYPFWKYTSQNKNAIYACINYEDISCPIEINKRSLLIKGDIDQVINNLLKEGK